MNPNPRRTTGRVAAASIGVGAAAAALLAAPLVTNAAGSPDSVLIAGTDEPDDTVEPADAATEEVTADIDAEADDAPNVGPHPGPELSEFPDGPGFPGRRGDGPGERRFRILNGEVIAEALGIDVEALRDELRSGATVAEIAEVNGVDSQVVIDALVADYTERVTAWIEGEQTAADESTDSATDSPDTTATTTT